MTDATLGRVPNTPGTPRRTIRVPDELWRAASERAKADGQDLSAVIRAYLEKYASEKPKKR